MEFNIKKAIAAGKVHEYLCAHPKRDLLQRRQVRGGRAVGGDLRCVCVQSGCQDNFWKCFKKFVCLSLGSLLGIDAQAEGRSNPGLGLYMSTGFLLSWRPCTEPRCSVQAWGKVRGTHTGCINSSWSSLRNLQIRSEKLSTIWWW